MNVDRADAADAASCTEECDVPRTLAGWPPWAVYTPRVPVDTDALFRAQLRREKQQFVTERWSRKA